MITLVQKIQRWWIARRRRKLVRKLHDECMQIIARGVKKEPRA